MQTQGSSVAWVVLRRVLAVVELLVAGLLCFLGIVFLMSPPIHHMDVRGVGPVLIFFALAAAVAALTAWQGRRRWWVWQAVAVGIPVLTYIGLMLWVNLF